MAKIWGFIGCGNLAQSVIEGALSLNALTPSQIIATDVDPSKLGEFCGRTGITRGENIQNVLNHSGIIVIATKPQDVAIVLEELSLSPMKNRAVVSLAAGVSDKFLMKYLSDFQAVARVMANTPALVQRGFFGVYFAKKNKEDELEVLEIFKKLGEVVVLKNNQQVDSLTSASASGVGFILSFMEEYEKWLKKHGFNSQESRKIAVEIFLGTSYLAKNREKVSLAELREAVTSKKGTTLAGLMAMKKAKVASGLKAGLDGGLRRAIEISKDLALSKDLLRGKK